MSGKNANVHLLLKHELHGKALPEGWYMWEPDNEYRYKTGIVYKFRNSGFYGIRYPAYAYMKSDGWFWVSVELRADIEAVGPFKELEDALAYATLVRGIGEKPADGVPDGTYGNGAY